MNIPNDLVRADLAPGGAAQVGNRRFRHLQSLKFLLCNRVGNGTRVALDLLFGKRGQASLPDIHSLAYYSQPAPPVRLHPR